jgi:hypothetical protein
MDVVWMALDESGGEGGEEDNGWDRVPEQDPSIKITNQSRCVVWWVLSAIAAHEIQSLLTQKTSASGYRDPSHTDKFRCEAD